MTEKKNSLRSTGMFISAMLIFGTVGVLRRYIPLPSAFLAFARGMIGGVFLMVYAKLRGKGAGPAPALRDVLRFALTGAMIGINWILLFEAFNCTTVAIATLCYYMEPTIVMLLSPLVFRERLTPKKAACAAVAIVGMVLVSGVVGGGGAGGGSLPGVLLGLGAALFYSCVVILNKKFSGSADAYVRTTVQLLAAGLVMLPYLLLTGGFAGGEFTPLSVLLLAVMGVVHTGIAYALYFGSMNALSVQSIAVLSYIDPVSALLFSAFLLAEPLTLPGVIGAVMIIGSAIVSEVRIRKS